MHKSNNEPLDYCGLFSNEGEISVEVYFKKFDGKINTSKMRAEEITKLIDPETGQFYTEMDFDGWHFFIYGIEINPITKKMKIRAIDDLTSLRRNPGKFQK